MQRFIDQVSCGVNGSGVTAASIPNSVVHRSIMASKSDVHHRFCHTHRSDPISAKDQPFPDPQAPKRRGKHRERDRAIDVAGKGLSSGSRFVQMYRSRGLSYAETRVKKWISALSVTFTNTGSAATVAKGDGLPSPPPPFCGGWAGQRPVARFCAICCACSYLVPSRELRWLQVPQHPTAWIMYNSL
jgi:hypothetical protein